MISLTQDITKKTTKNDFRHSVESTKFGKNLGMSKKCEICVEIQIVNFPLMFPTHPQKWNSDIGNSRYRKKTTKMTFDNRSNLSLEKVLE